MIPHSPNLRSVSNFLLVNHKTHRFGVIPSLLILPVVGVWVGGVGRDHRHVVVLHYHRDRRQSGSQGGPLLFLLFGRTGKFQGSLR